MCIKLRQSASGTRSCNAVHMARLAGWQPHVDGKMGAGKWPYVAPVPCPPCSCASLIDKSGRAGESVGTRGPLVPSSQVELWSPIYLGSGGMSLYVGIVTDLYQCSPKHRYFIQRRADLDHKGPET